MTTPTQNETTIDRAGSGLIEMLGTILGRRSFQAGQQIFAQGDDADVAYAVLRGHVDITTVNSAGVAVILTTVNPGQFFGEMALMTHSPRSANAVTPDGCELLALPRTLLDSKMATASPFLKLWIETLASRVIAGSNCVTAPD